MPGLFQFASPQEVRQQQGMLGQQQDMQRAQLAPGRGMVATASQSGRMLGEGIGRMMGNIPPQEEEAQKLQEAMAEVQSSGIDLQSDPVGFMKRGISAMTARGLHGHAYKIWEQLNAYEGSLSEGKYKKEKDTAEFGLKTYEAESGRMKAEAAYKHALAYTTHIAKQPKSTDPRDKSDYYRARVSQGIIENALKEHGVKEISQLPSEVI